MSKKQTMTQAVPYLQLSLPLNRQPLLKLRSKIRNKETRELIDTIWTNSTKLKSLLDNGSIQSPEVRVGLREFLASVGMR
jgi:hypothetical protein